MSETLVRRVVVGTDGSPNSIAAIRMAADEAKMRGAELHVVHAWTFQPAPPAFAPVPPLGPTLEEQESSAGRILSDAVREALGDEPDMVVVERLVNGPAGEVMQEVGRDAELLVLGARGHSGFLGVLLGSTALTAVKHAPCPILVVPGHLTDEPETATLGSAAAR